MQQIYIILSVVSGVPVAGMTESNTDLAKNRLVQNRLCVLLLVCEPRVFKHFWL